MNRRIFVEHALSGTMLGVEFSPEPDLVIERRIEGKPHAGKVLVAIQPHSDMRRCDCEPKNTANVR